MTDFHTTPLAGTEDLIGGSSALNSPSSNLPTAQYPTLNNMANVTWPGSLEDCYPITPTSPFRLCRSYPDVECECTEQRASSPTVTDLNHTATATSQKPIPTYDNNWHPSATIYYGSDINLPLTTTEKTSTDTLQKLTSSRRNSPPPSLSNDIWGDIELDLFLDDYDTSAIFDELLQHEVPSPNNFVEIPHVDCCTRAMKTEATVQQLQKSAPAGHRPRLTSHTPSFCSTNGGDRASTPATSIASDTSRRRNLKRKRSFTEDSDTDKEAVERQKRNNAASKRSREKRKELLKSDEASIGHYMQENEHLSECMRRLDLALIRCRDLIHRRFPQ